MASLQKYCDWYDSIRKVSLENQFIASPRGSRQAFNLKKVNGEIAASSVVTEGISFTNPGSSSSSETSSLSGRRYLKGYNIPLS